MKYNDQYFTFLDQDRRYRVDRVYNLYAHQADDSTEIHRPKK